MADRFFVGDVDADTDDAGNWAATSGGAGGAGIPGTGDDAFWDINSPDCDIDATLSVLSADFTAYVNEIDGLPMAFVLIVGTGGAILENTATFTRFNLRVLDATATVDFDGATIKIFEVTNTTASNLTVTIASGTVNLTTVMAFTCTSTGELVVDFGTNNPDVVTPNFQGSEASTGFIGVNMGSGTWFYTGATYDLSTMTGVFETSSVTLQIDMPDSNFTWDTFVNQTPHNLIINFNQGTNREFNVTNPSSTVIAVSGRLEMHVLGAGDLEIDWRTYTCPDGFITEEASTGNLTIDSTVDISSIICRGGVGINEVDLRGLSTLAEVSLLTIGDASYILRPGSVPLILPSFVSTLLTSTPRTITVAGDTFDVANHWDIDFTDDASCDDLIVIFTNCIYDGGGGAFQTVNNKNAATDFDLDLGTQSWLVAINGSGNGNGTLFNDVNIVTHTSGTITFLMSGVDVVDLDLRTEFNNVIFLGGGTQTVTFEPTRSPKINGTLTFEINTSAGTITFDFNPAQVFEVVGDFEMKVTSGTTNHILEMGSNTWKMGGNVTIGTGSQITISSETSNLELNGLALQTIILDNAQMNTVTVTNGSGSGIIFDDAVDFNELDADTGVTSSPIAIRFKAGLSHVINALTLTGSGINTINLRSTVLDTQWLLTVTGINVVDHVNVRDSDASASVTDIDALDSTNFDADNNDGWDFGITDADFQTVEFGQLATAGALRIPVAVAHSLEFTQVPDVIKRLLSSVSHTLEFAQDPTIGAVWIGDVTHTLEMAQGTDTEDELACVIDNVIIRNNVTFWFPFTEMTNKVVMPSPELGDEHEIHTRVIARHTRGGALRAYNQGFVFEVFNFTFLGLNRTKRDEIIAFAIVSRADIVRFRDHENRVWKGMITSSPTVLQSVGRSSPGGEDYTVAMSFEGTQIA